MKGVGERSVDLIPHLVDRKYPLLLFISPCAEKCLLKSNITIHNTVPADTPLFLISNAPLPALAKSAEDAIICFFCTFPIGGGRTGRGNALSW